MGRDPWLRPYIPKTLKATPENFNKMLDFHKDVIFKPIQGSGSKNIYCITSLGNSQYLIHHESKRVKVHTRKKVFRYLHIPRRSSRYLVQARILLMQVKGRLCDIRVVTQRRKNSGKWEVTGRVARVAGRGYIVTDLPGSGSAVYRLQTALRNSALPASARRCLPSAINRLSIRAAKQLNKLYRHHRIFGFDIGADRSGKPWILEANKRPDLSYFTQLGDYRTYRRINSIKGRTYIKLHNISPKMTYKWKCQTVVQT